jgi:hypothetical protein
MKSNKLISKESEKITLGGILGIGNKIIAYHSTVLFPSYFPSASAKEDRRGCYL